MRDQPWHVRNLATQHLVKFRNILDLHALTLEWLKELELKGHKQLIERGVEKKLSETLWFLEPLTEIIPTDDKANTEKLLQSLLDDTAPDDLLNRMDRTVNIVQSWVLSALFKRVSEDDRITLRSQLEQSSWLAGRRCAEERWPQLTRNTRNTMKGIFSAFLNTPISGVPEAQHLLVRRLISTELHLEFLVCPHRSSFEEVKLLADELCSLYTHWMRGFAYAINTKIFIEYLPGNDRSRCEQKWILN